MDKFLIFDYSLRRAVCLEEIDREEAATDLEKSADSVVSLHNHCKQSVIVI